MPNFEIAEHAGRSNNNKKKKNMFYFVMHFTFATNVKVLQNDLEFC